MRAGDSDREAVATVLREALGEGRLDLAEVDERLTHVYAARTYAELEAVVSDLPDLPLPWRATTLPAVAAADDERPLELGGGWSSEKRDGVWQVPRRITVRSGASDVKLDFRAATCPHRRIDIEVEGGMNGLVLVLPDDWSVDTDALDGRWGSVKNRHRAPAAPGRPTIVVTGKTGMGSVKTRGPYFYE